MPKPEVLLEPFESVIWSGKPDKKAFILPAFAYIIYLLPILAAPLIMLIFGFPLLHPLSIIAISAIIIAMTIPPIWKYRKYTHERYIITSNRLIVKTGAYNGKSWTAKLDEIKEVFVKTGIVDELFGTGKLYPITLEHPYEPKRYLSPGSDPTYALRKVYNVADQKYDEISQVELARRVQSHPKLEDLKTPFKIQKILKDAIKDYKNQSTNFASQ